jgi:hypothetical protein
MATAIHKWHYRQASQIAARIVTYEIDDLPESLSLMPSEQIRAFEDAVYQYQKENQKFLESNPKNRKPESAGQTTDKFGNILNFESFGEWSRKQQQLEAFEEAVA